MEPNKGYRAGGTKVTITGEHLDIGSQVRVMVNSTHECVITEWVQLVLLLYYYYLKFTNFQVLLKSCLGQQLRFNISNSVVKECCSLKIWSCVMFPISQENR